MTVLQKVPRPDKRSARVQPSPDPATFDQTRLSSPNLADLKPAEQVRGEHLLAAMLTALQAQDVPAFNEAREELCGWLKRHGQPVTQWNPLVLILPDGLLLRGASLMNINLSMVSLRAITGHVSLEEACLQGASLLCADVSGANLSQADLSGVDARFADFCDAQLERALLVGVDLSHAKLTAARLSLSNLYCARLNNAILKHAQLEEVNLRKSDLRNADLYHAVLRNARLQQSDLREANLFMADLRGARLRHADLRKAHLVRADLTQARLNNARLQEVNLTSSNLCQANLHRCRLNEAVLNRAILSQAQMQETDLQGASLSECPTLEQASLCGALYDNQTVFPRQFKPQKYNLARKQAQGLTRWLERLTRLFTGMPQPLPH